MKVSHTFSVTGGFCLSEHTPAFEELSILFYRFLKRGLICLLEISSSEPSLALFPSPWCSLQAGLMADLCPLWPPRSWPSALCLISRFFSLEIKSALNSFLFGKTEAQGHQRSLFKWLCPSRVCFIHGAPCLFILKNKNKNTTLSSGCR